MKFTGLILLMATCVAVNAQVQTDGACPTFSVKTNFDTTKYLGRWYEYSKNPTKFEEGGTCNIANYEDKTANGKVVLGVLNQRIDNGKWVSAKGNAELGEPNNAEKPGKFIVNFYDPPSTRTATETNYNVLDTDYDTYTIVYACSARAGKKNEFLWLLTRQQTPPATVTNAAMQKIQNMGIETANMKTVKQTDCPEAPNASTTAMASPLSLAFVAIFQIFALTKFF